MVRSVLVVSHAGSGIAGLVAGLYALSPPRADGRGWARGAYAVCIGILLGSLAGLLAVDWAGLDTTARIAFGALAGLGAVMAAQLIWARREAATRGTNWQERYIDRTYFTYIALWEGFVILPALNLPLPQVTVPAVAIGVLLVGHALIGRFKARVMAA
jgi:hypothetical protein